MVLQIDLSPTMTEKRERVLKTLQKMQQWPYWNEVYLNCVKESPLSYESFVAAVRAGDSSPQAFDDAMRMSQMTREEFQTYLPEFLRYMSLYKEYAPLGMLSDCVDQIWHGFMLITSQYREFCEQFFGYPIDHLPCSLYPLYGIERPSSSCLASCLPQTCNGDGKPGCTSKKHSMETTAEDIIAATQGFIDAYSEVFGTAPDVRIWNQLQRVT